MIYETLLGANFKRLHPKLQQRYQLDIGDTFYARGTMTHIHTGPRLLKPLYQLMTYNQFLFPESGTDIPFTLTNYASRQSDGTIAVAWERHFHFPHTTRTFIATMHINFDKKTAADYLGKPALMHSDLQLNVTADGFLMIRANKQYALGFGLPRSIGGSVCVIEGYDEAREVFTIHASIANPLLGTMMMYAGTFQAIR